MSDDSSLGSSTGRQSGTKSAASQLELRQGMPEAIKHSFKFDSSSKDGDVMNYLYDKKRKGLSQKCYWQSIIEDVECSVQKLTQPRIPQIDYTVVLPPRLRARVNKIQSYDYDLDDKEVYTKELKAVLLPEIYKHPSPKESVHEPVIEALRAIEEKNKKPIQFDESQHSEIMRLQKDFRPFELKVDEPVLEAPKQPKKINWMTKIVCVGRQDKVPWKTHLKIKKYLQQPTSVDDEADELMEAASERFSSWLNSIGTGEEIITAENVQSLFAIKGDRTLLSSIRTEPREVKAVAQTVAQKWNKPNISIESKYEQHIFELATRKPVKPIISAFGRTVPMKDRPWQKCGDEKIIETVFPKELLSRERIFKGITHLRSTSAVMAFYLKNPTVARPEFLTRIGDFEELLKKDAMKEPPLYDLLGLRY